MLNNHTDPMAVLAQALLPYLPSPGGKPLFKAQTVGAPEGPYLHGPGGLFGVLGLERPIISTHIGIGSSVAAAIPVTGGSNLDNPLFAYITGFIRSDQEEKDAVCDNPAEAGNMKTCIMTTAFGRKEFMSRQVEVNRIGHLRNSGETDNLFIENSPLVPQMAGIMSQRFALDRNISLAAGKEMVARIVEIGVAFQRWLCPQVYTGNPANSSAGGGYKEFLGLDTLIGTTKLDAISGATCPSLYSLVRDYNYENVQSTTAAYNIVHIITNMFRYLAKKSVQQNLNPVEWVLAMRSGLFDAIVDVWPCNYNTYRCQFTAESGDGNGGISLNDDFAVRMRDEMRLGSYLLVDGRKVFVIQDDCIDEDTTADNASIPVGGYASDIYILPMTARGGSMRTLYWEFYDYSKDVMPAIRDINAGMYFWSDNGRFLWHLKGPDNWCLEFIAKIEPRLLLRTPQLAGRLTNVVYVPLIHYDDPLPSQPYWLDGGNPSGYPAPSPYTEWNLSGPGGQ